MNHSGDEKKEKKEALKKLREARKETIAAATRRMKEQRKAFDALKGQLKEGAKTVPELAEGAGISTSEAMWCVAAMKNYGEVAEAEKDGCYFRYELVGAAESSASDSIDEG